MDSFKDWWNQASSRDQLYLVVLGGCVALYIMYMFVLKPVQSMKEDQIKQNNSALAAQARVQALATQWKNRNSSGSGKAASGSLVEVVDRSLRQNNLKLSGMQPSGSKDVRLRLEQAPFDRVLTWLHKMEIAQGIIIKDLSIATGSDPGVVSVNVRLHRE